jgi:transcriptional regulator with XRE-family HTH domain
MRFVKRLVGARLKQLRDEQEISATQAAAAVGVEVSHLYALERGDSTPGLETAVGLALVYKVDVADLYVFPGTHLRHDLRELIRLTPSATLADVKTVLENTLRDRTSRKDRTSRFEQQKPPKR